MLQNNRRRAANAVKTVGLKITPATDQNVERRKILADGKLTPYEEKMLQEYKTEDGRTEADVFTVFLCRPVASQGRIAVETDIPPLMVAEKIIGLDKMENNTQFGLPTCTVHAPEWRDHIPRFATWLISRARYPEIASAVDKKNIIPNQMNMSAKSLSRVDEIETYFAVFHATLMQYFYTGDETTAKLAWQVLRTIRFLISQFGCAKQVSEQEKQTLLQFVEKRDASLEDAIAFKEFVKSLHPAQYYAALYSLMRTNPEIVHKSQIVNVESLIWGYLTQTQLSYEESLPLSALDTDILRLTIERGLQKASLPNHPKCATMEELVPFCHERMGSRLQNLLRTTCQSWSLLRVLDSSSSISWPDFQETVVRIRTSVKELDGIMAFCMLLDPKTTLTDESLAEMWLAKCQSPNKFATLNWRNEQVATPLLEKIIQETLEDAKKAQDAMEQVKKQLEEKVGPDPDELLRDFRGHIYTRAGMERYGQLLYQLAQSPENIAVLDALIKKCPFLSQRRQITFVLRSVSPQSPVFTHFLRPTDNFAAMTSIGSTGWMHAWLWKVKLNLGVVQKQRRSHDKEEEQEQQPRNEIIKFVAFQVSRELSNKVAAALNAIKIRAECGICFDSVKKMIVLHGDKRHIVCVTCAPLLKDCPFCRAPL